MKKMIVILVMLALVLAVAAAILTGFASKTETYFADNCRVAIKKPFVDTPLAMFTQNHCTDSSAVAKAAVIFCLCNQKIRNEAAITHFSPAKEALGVDAQCEQTMRFLKGTAPKCLAEFGLSRKQFKKIEPPDPFASLESVDALDKFIGQLAGTATADLPYTAQEIDKLKAAIPNARFSLKLSTLGQVQGGTLLPKKRGAVVRYKLGDETEYYVACSARCGPIPKSKRYPLGKNGYFYTFSSENWNIVVWAKKDSSRYEALFSKRAMQTVTKAIEQIH